MKLGLCLSEKLLLLLTLRIQHIISKFLHTPFYYCFASVTLRSIGIMTSAYVHILSNIVKAIVNMALTIWRWHISRCQCQDSPWSNCERAVQGAWEVILINWPPQSRSVDNPPLKAQPTLASLETRDMAKCKDKWRGWVGLWSGRKKLFCQLIQFIGIFIDLSDSYSDFFQNSFW